MRRTASAWAGAILCSGLVGLTGCGGQARPPGLTGSGAAPTQAAGGPGGSPSPGMGGMAGLAECVCAGCLAVPGTTTSAPQAPRALANQPVLGARSSPSDSMMSSSAAAAAADDSTCWVSDPLIGGPGAIITLAYTLRWKDGRDETTSGSWSITRKAGETGDGTFDTSTFGQTYFRCSARGDVTVTATSDCGASYSVTLTCAGIVLPPPPPGCAGLSLVEVPRSAAVGGSTPVRAETVGTDPGSVRWEVADPAIASIQSFDNGAALLVCARPGKTTVTATADCPSCGPPGCPASAQAFEIDCCGLSLGEIGVTRQSGSGATLIARFQDTQVAETWSLRDPGLGTLDRTSGVSTTFTCQDFGEETITVTGRFPGQSDSTCSTLSRQFSLTCDVLPDGRVRPGLCPAVFAEAFPSLLPVGQTTAITAVATAGPGLYPGATYQWTVAPQAGQSGNGRVSDPTRAATLFTCTEPGLANLQVSAARPDDPACAATAGAGVTCCPAAGTFQVAAGATTVPVGVETSLAASGFAGPFNGWDAHAFVGQTGSLLVTNPRAASTTFVCVAAGQVTLAATTSGATGCDGYSSVVITCAPSVGSSGRLPAECLPPPAQAGQSIAFQPLGLPPDTIGDVFPTAISADGGTVIGRVQYGTEKIFGADGPTFTWTAAHGFTPFPGATFTAINADGTVIVGQRTDETWAQRAAVWKNGAAGAFVSLDPKATADAVSDDGRVVIGFQDDLGALGGYRWSSTCGLAWLPSVDGYAVHPTAVSRDGTFVVGLAATRGGRVPVRWSPTQGAERLTVPMAAGDARVSARPFVVLADGTTLGTIDVEYPSGDEPNTTRAAKWTPGNQLVYLQPDAEDLYRASADGSVVTSNQGIWDAAHGWRDVTTVVEQAGGHPSGWELYFADDISADGKTLLGTGRCGGHTLAWIMRLP